LKILEQAMQFKLFTIPVTDDGQAVDEMNRFLKAPFMVLTALSLTIYRQAAPDVVVAVLASSAAPR
jgi:hypothetical protein